MKQELIGLLLVISGAVVALVFSRTVRAMVKEALVHPKQACEIEVTRNNVTVTTQHKAEVNNVRS